MTVTEKFYGQNIYIMKNSLQYSQMTITENDHYGEMTITEK